MKLKKIGIGLFVVAMVGASAITAFAANGDFKEAAGKLFATVKTYDEGEIPEIPEGAVMLEKIELEKEDLESNVSVEIKTYDEGEMPEIPDGAIMMNKEIIEE